MAPVMGFRVECWGLLDYAEAYERQKRLVSRVADGAEDVLVFVEHPSVITLGRRSSQGNVLVDRAQLRSMNIELVVVDRGGDVTLHAPGQLVIYPVINLRRRGFGLREYLRYLEQVVVDFLEGFGIVAQGDDNRRGVWVSGRKIASIGVGISRWTTYHGAAVNLSNNLNLFRLIRPCGLDVAMTSLEQECGRRLNPEETLDLMSGCFGKLL